MGIEHLVDAIIELGPVLFPVTILAVVAVLMQRKKRRLEAWKGAADHLGFQLSQRSVGTPSFRMNGIINHVPVELKVVATGSGKKRSWNTVAIAELSSGVPTGMVVGKESFFTRIGEALGYADIQIGVQSVDDVLHIRGADEIEVRKYLASVSVQKTLVELVNFGNGSGLRSSDVYLRQRGIVEEMATLVSMATLSAQFSTLLCGAKDSVESSPRLETESVTTAPIETFLMDSKPDESAIKTEPDEADQIEEVERLVVDEVASRPDWHEVTRLLCDRNTRRSEKRDVAKKMEGQSVEITLVVKRTTVDRDTVDSTTGAYGALVYGTHNGLEIELRVAPKDAEGVAELKRDDCMEGVGVIVGWDQFYGRMNMDFQS